MNDPQVPLRFRFQKQDILSRQATKCFQYFHGAGLNLLYFESPLLSRLIGRATVEFTVEKKDGSVAFVDRAAGGMTTRGIVKMVVDG